MTNLTPSARRAIRNFWEAVADGASGPEIVCLYQDARDLVQTQNPIHTRKEKPVTLSQSITNGPAPITLPLDAGEQSQSDPTTKECTKCHEEKPISQFAGTNGRITKLCAGCRRKAREKSSKTKSPKKQGSKTPPQPASLPACPATLTLPLDQGLRLLRFILDADLTLSCPDQTLTLPTHLITHHIPDSSILLALIQPEDAPC